MEYLYCKDDNFEDFASGRVLYGGKGIPNFPVRLLAEIFGRARSYCKKADDLVVYDPCCGGGYALTVLGFFYNKEIGKIYGSDIDANMIARAEKNLTLLSDEGLEMRRSELNSFYQAFGKESHQEAIHSCDKLKEMLGKEIATEIFQADCTKDLQRLSPDVIITDVPYGNLVKWQENAALNPDEMMKRLWDISREGTVLAVCMDKKQKCHTEQWSRIEKQSIGKRRFEIYIKRT